MHAETPSFRIESDSMGEVNVPADRYWGAQTERSRAVSYTHLTLSTIYSV